MSLIFASLHLRAIFVIEIKNKVRGKGAEKIKNAQFSTLLYKEVT